jgi:hypothetical protein
MGGDALAMEASSHALDQERTAGIDFDVAVFTNLTRDHLDYHGDFDAYARAKERLFATLQRTSTAVVNADDPASTRMADAARRAGARVVTYSARTSGDLCASDVRTDLRGTQLFLNGMGISRTLVWLPLAGRYNVENARSGRRGARVGGESFQHFGRTRNRTQRTRSTRAGRDERSRVHAARRLCALRGRARERVQRLALDDRDERRRST